MTERQGRKLTSYDGIFQIVRTAVVSILGTAFVVTLALNGLPEALVLLPLFGWLLYYACWRTGYRLEVAGDDFVWRAPLRSVAFQRKDVVRVRGSHWTLFVTWIFVIELRNGRRLPLMRSRALVDWLGWSDERRR